MNWFDYVTAWCSFSQDPHFTLAHHRVSSSSVVEHPTRSRRVVGSNPIWNSGFLFPSFSVNAKFIMLYFYRKTHLAAGWLHLRYALMWLRDAVLSHMCTCLDLNMWLRDAVLVKTHISPLLTIGSPVAQWQSIRLDHGGSWVQIPSGTRHFFFRVFQLMQNLSNCT